MHLRCPAARPVVDGPCQSAAGPVVITDGNELGASGTAQADFTTFPTHGWLS